jgi:hypothetical protein
MFEGWTGTSRTSSSPLSFFFFACSSLFRMLAFSLASCDPMTLFTAPNLRVFFCTPIFVECGSCAGVVTILKGWWGEVEVVTPYRRAASFESCRCDRTFEFKVYWFGGASPHLHIQGSKSGVPCFFLFVAQPSIPSRPQQQCWTADSDLAYLSFSSPHSLVGRLPTDSPSQTPTYPNGNWEAGNGGCGEQSLQGSLFQIALIPAVACPPSFDSPTIPLPCPE